LSHDLNLIRAERKRVQGGWESVGVVGGDVEAVETGEEGENYVLIKKREKKEEEEEGGEGEAKGEEAKKE
jgi:hypothetical protein